MKKAKRKLLMIAVMAIGLLAATALVVMAGSLDQDMASQWNAEMAAADAKALADKAGAAADQVLVTTKKKADQAQAIQALMKKKTEAAVPGMKIRLAANVTAGMLDKAIKAQQTVSFPSIYSLATQRYFDHALYPAAIATTESLTGQGPIVAVAAGCKFPNIAVCETVLRANKVATLLLTFKTTSVLENFKAEAGYVALQLNQRGSAACAPVPAMNC